MQTGITVAVLNGANAPKSGVAEEDIALKQGYCGLPNCNVQSCQPGGAVVCSLPANRQTNPLR